VRTSDSVKDLSRCVVGNSDLPSPAVSNSSDLLVLLLLLEQSQPLANGFGLSVDSSRESSKEIASLFVSPVSSAPICIIGNWTDSSVPENMSAVAYCPLRKSGM